MVWLMWYMAECCEWNWMFICRYCRYHSHNCGKENLKLTIIFVVALNVKILRNNIMVIDKYSYNNKCYLHIWNVSYHVLQHKFDGVYMLQQFEIVA